MLQIHDILEKLILKFYAQPETSFNPKEKKPRLFLILLKWIENLTKKNER